MKRKKRGGGGALTRLNREIKSTRRTFTGDRGKSQLPRIILVEGQRPRARGTQKRESTIRRLHKKERTPKNLLGVDRA